MKLKLIAVIAFALVPFLTEGAAAKTPFYNSDSQTSASVIARVVPEAATLLYNQDSNAGGATQMSQNFETRYDAYDSNAADDFVVPDGETWNLSSIVIPGVYYSGNGPTKTARVAIYRDNDGKPGEAVFEANIPPTEDGAGTFGFRSSKRSVSLPSGTYWLSVTANLSLGSGGLWYWGMRPDTVGNRAVWRNPGGAYEGCADWADAWACGSMSPGDLRFTIYGTKTN